ncbi:MAG: YqaE/Pmp3 family membrane protein [Opitutales bacterium]
MCEHPRVPVSANTHDTHYDNKTIFTVLAILFAPLAVALESGAGQSLLVKILLFLIQPTT